MMRNGCQADVAICTGGTLRADCVFRRGPLTEGDVTSLLPFMDEMAVVSLTGAQVCASARRRSNRTATSTGHLDCYHYCWC